MRSSLALLTLVLLAAGCGGGKEPAQATPPPPSETSTSPSSPNVLTGDWKESAGQSDKIQETLSKDGFACSKHSADHVDLRMCVKTLPAPAPDKPAPSTRIKFLADGKGTVVRAAVDGNASGLGKAVRTAALKALLPEQDVAVVEANGQTLTWGTMKEQRDTLHLVVKGGENAPRVLNPINLGGTKEEALPKMQAAGFKCEFKSPIGAQQQTSLECSKFGSDFPDIQRSATLTDEGNGLSSVTVKAWLGKTTQQNTAALKSIAPDALGVTDELKDVKDWVEKHLDGQEHSAYVGNYIVTIQVSLNLMMGNSAAVNVTHEKNEFGATSR